jgi:hypothetical protein
MSPVATHRGRTGAAIGAGLALCAWCGWVSGFPHSSVGALAAWSASLLGVGAADMWLWRAARAGRAAPFLETRSPVTVDRSGGAWLVAAVPWTVLFVVVLAWEILGIDTGRHAPHLTVSALAQVYRPLNAILWLVWLFVGFAFGVVRARATLGQAERSGQGTEERSRNSP